ncbi:lamin tail domain-containing protein [Algoriphagus halophytocola]|uniref:Lamin tail domain-containing protein n=1 Tax=Algoriphagus halophytocola TaxID=2991499 RepID=A0ABY6ME52_9BACT|nr:MULTISPECIES: lamin tail domain-containing protein [unclassified Algoriphagus]UZD21209.1 lamin tail domain-containing protein [Algoriphagus sp. TR-M5]WBL42419.1 lamin tail domain-containing protein [Algoriphagus sp. TR-M9]
MVSLFFIWQLVFFEVLSSEEPLPISELRLVQNFESDFDAVNRPEAFLPGWFGNEIRDAASRIYQGNGLGRNGSRALVVQPISTFDGEVIIRLDPSDLSAPKVRFWARSLQNGSGDRPALVYFSWGLELDGVFSDARQLGEPDEFANENQEFRSFTFSLPEGMTGLPEVYLKLQVIYGEGAGTCAKWMMDDFELGDLVEDTQSPKVSDVRGFDEKVIQLTFDEALDPVFSEFSMSYKLDGLEPASVVLEKDSLVLLQFDEKLEKGRDYEVQIRQIPDLEGNFMQDTTVYFRFFDPTAFDFKTLVINEIMPAPRPDLDLPNAEYVEIYHAGEHVIRLGGLSFANSRTEVKLPEQWVSPGEYFLLVPKSDAALFEDTGQVMPLSPWPALLNSGDELSLIDDSGKLIDHISYQTSSWGGSEFSGGGYSLEVSNPYRNCDQSELLASSTDPLRGTPGKQNSNFDLSPDTSLPTLIAAYFSSDSSMVLTFSEAVQVSSDQSNWSSEPELLVDTTYSLSSTEVFVSFAGSVMPNQHYAIQFGSVSDCAGNESGPLSLSLILPQKAELGDVMINELLFNAKSGSPKFVELVNVTDSYLEIGDWVLANLDEDGVPDQIRVLSESPLVLEPRDFLAISSDSSQLKLDFPKSSFGNFHQLSSLPSYPIGGGTVVLLTSEMEVAENFTYSDELHHPLLRDSKGVSLERISLESPASLADNWQTASSNEDFGTPGKANSNVLSDEFKGDIITIEPEIFDPEGSSGNSFTRISYEFEQAGWTGSFSIYATDGRLIQTLAQNQILGSSGFYTWHGTDELGGRVRAGYYVLLVELFDLDGRKSTMKKTLVVATQLK